MCGGGSSGGGSRNNSGGLLGGGYGSYGGWQVSPQLSRQYDTTAMVRSPQQYGGNYQGSPDQQQQWGGGGYSGPRIPGQPGTGIHAGDVWNPTKDHWNPNPTGAVIPQEWRNHPGAYLYRLAHGTLPGQSTPTPTPQAATPPPPTYWGSLEDQWAQFSNNPADWAPGTDMQAAKAAFMNANGYQVPGYMQAMPLPQFVTDEPTNG